MIEINKIQNLKEFGGIQRDDAFAVDFRLSTKCNYGCWYCKDLHDNKNPNHKIDLVKLENFFKALNRKCVVFLYGGEPTIHPQFIDVVRTIANAISGDSYIEIQTNFTLSKNKILELKNIGKTYVLASYHYNECDFKEFIEKCFCAIGILKQITVMYQADLADDILEKFRRIKMLFGRGNGLGVELMPLLCGSVDENEEQPYREIDKFYEDKRALEISNSGSYGGRQLRGVKDNGEEFLTRPNDLWKNRENCFKDMMCNVSVERIIIDYDGSCYKCFNEIFDLKAVPEYNIFTQDNPEEYINSLKVMKCPYDKCFFEFTHKKFKD